MLFLPSSVRLYLRFSPLTKCLAAAGWKASKRHWLAQTSASLVCYPVASSSLSSPSPHYVPQEPAARSWARMPEKIFPRRRAVRRRENPLHLGFLYFFFPYPLVRLRRARLADPFPFRRRLNIRSMTTKFLVDLFCSLSFSFFFSTVCTFLSSLPLVSVRLH